MGFHYVLITSPIENKNKLVNQISSSNSLLVQGGKRF